MLPPGPLPHTLRVFALAERFLVLSLLGLFPGCVDLGLDGARGVKYGRTSARRRDLIEELKDSITCLSNAVTASLSYGFFDDSVGKLKTGRSNEAM